MKTITQKEVAVMTEILDREIGVQAVSAPEVAGPPAKARPRGPERQRIRYGNRVWMLVVLDVMAVAWMTSAGDWFAERGVLGVITLGGHPSLVMALATASFVILAALAVPTEGFGRASQAELGLLVVAVVLTAVALAGLLSVALLVVGGGIFVGLLVKLFVR